MRPNSSSHPAFRLSDIRRVCDWILCGRGEIVSRSEYMECEASSLEEQWAHIRWRGAVKSAMRGIRGQKLLRDLRDGMDAMSEKKLIANHLEKDGCFCAMGVVAKNRGLNISKLDANDSEQVAESLNIAEAMAREIAYTNDEHWELETDRERWLRVRRWVEINVKETHS